MELEHVTELVIYSAFGAMLGWYLWVIGYSIYSLVKWIKKMIREHKEKKVE